MTDADLFPYGCAAFKLLKELKRMDTLKHNPFDEDSKRKSLEEITHLVETIQSIVEREDDTSYLDSPYIQNFVLLNHHSAYRIKQCLFCYVSERIKMIQKVRWQTGSEIVPDDIETSLTPSEKRFLGSYNESLRDLSSSLGIDLMFDINIPPKDMYIDTLVLSENKPILIENGFLPLKKDSLIHIRRTDAEPLIKSGILSHVKL